MFCQVSSFTTRKKSLSEPSLVHKSKKDHSDDVRRKKTIFVMHLFRSGPPVCQSYFPSSCLTTCLESSFQSWCRNFDRTNRLSVRSEQLAPVKRLFLFMVVLYHHCTVSFCFAKVHALGVFFLLYSPCPFILFVL